MRSAVVLIFGLLFFVSCEKDELILETPPTPRQEAISIDEHVGNTYRVVAYNFKDHVTQEEYDLLKVNQECDSMYFHFGEVDAIMVRVFMKNGHSFYKWDHLAYQEEKGQLYLVQDEYLRYKVTSLDNRNIKFEGTHELHQQFQTVHINFGKMNVHPTIVKKLNPSMW